MLVLKSTRDQMVKEAKATGAAALREIIGELTDGLKMLGLRAEPKPGETTAEMVVRLFRSQMAATEQFREEVAETRATLVAANAELSKYKRGLSLGTQASADRRRFEKECREQVADRKAGRGAFAVLDPAHH